MGKKKKSELDKQFGPSRRACRTTASTRRDQDALWDILVPFSDYAFNKAHSAAYGVVSYWTAYLKAHYPAEYMAALLTSVRRRQGQVGDLPQRMPADGHQGAAARRQRVGRATSPPVGTDIRFGMGAIRNVGDNVVEAIVAAREEKGAFTSFQRLPRRRCPRWSATSAPSSR